MAGIILGRQFFLPKENLEMSGYTRMTRRDAMRTLGLIDDIASEKAIKLAYRKAAIKWHPDKNAGEQ